MGHLKGVLGLKFLMGRGQKVQLQPESVNCPLRWGVGQFVFFPGSCTHIDPWSFLTLPSSHSACANTQILNIKL